MSPPQLASGSLYQEFSIDPNSNKDLELVDVHMTMTCQDGTVLYESGDNWNDLLHTIIRNDDDIALKQYISIKPSAVGNEYYEDPPSWSPFYNAAESGSLKALQVLLAHQETVTIKPGFVSYKELGFCLLNEAARHGHIEMVQFLLDNNADIHERDDSGYTPLAAAANRYSVLDKIRPSTEKGTAIMNLLLDRGASASDIVEPWSPDMGVPDTVLTLAVQWAGTELVKRLIREGADVHFKLTRDPFRMGWTDEEMDYISNVASISIASFHLNLDTIKVLFGAGVNITDTVSVRDSTDNLPLHWATRSHRRRGWMNVPSSVVEQETERLIRVIKLLSKAHPEAVNSQDMDGNTPFHIATQHPLRQHKHYTAVFELLCTRGAAASIRNNKKETPLHTLLSDPFASSTVDVKAIDILIANGASVLDTDEAGNSPLHHAAMDVNHADVISALLQRSADVNLRNAAQDTPLHLAGLSPFRRSASLDERERLQDNVMATLSKAAGPGGIEMLNGEGKTAQQVCQEQRKIRREEEVARLAIEKRRAARLR
ncbi:hypothetical protein LB507_011255 [Fusarium sp. FIESC RH6]|nr:hypothetical protein LB507_011255 [Fusarium sp. FIESC RH6]